MLTSNDTANLQRCVCMCILYVCVVGERRCTKFNQPQPCLNSSPDCVYTVGMIYVSWTSSRSGSDVSQMRVSIIPPGPSLLWEGVGTCYWWKGREHELTVTWFPAKLNSAAAAAKLLQSCPKIELWTPSTKWESIITRERFSIGLLHLGR